MATYKLHIYEWINPPSPANRFRIAEVYSCIDGWRTRMTDHSFPTLEAAQEFVKDPIKPINIPEVPRG